MLLTTVSLARLPRLAAVGLATVGLLAATTSASAARLAPFHARVAETYTAAPCPPDLCITARGTGWATRMGRISESATVVSNISTPAPEFGPGCITETRTTTLTAANGDQIRLDARGHNCPSGPTGVSALDTYRVTGGTGRFSGASGNGTIAATIDRATGTAVVVFSGTLSSPRSGHDGQRGEDDDGMRELAAEGRAALHPRARADR